MTFATDLNKGYEDGFNGNDASFPNNEEYMSGYRIGSADGHQRQSHLSMKDWLNDKADERNKDQK